MRKTWFLAGLIMGFLLIAGVAKSQIAPMFTELRVTVPFQFYAGDTPLNAGGYSVARQNVLEPQVPTLTKADGSKTVFMMVHLRGMAAPAKMSGLWFNKYGNEYFLPGMAIEGYDNVQELNRSRSEELAGEGELRSELILPAIRK